MLNLNSTIDLDVKAFFRWWQRELGFLVPERIKRLINDKQGYLIISAENNHLALSFYNHQHTETLALLERNELGVAQYKDLLEKDERLAKATTILRLGKHEAIHTFLTLPSAVKENLAQVVSYELDKYSPFKAEQVYFAVKPLPNSHNENGQINVLLVMTPKEQLDGLYDDLKQLGIAPVFADCSDQPNDLDDNRHHYNLLPDAFRQKVAKTPQLIYSGVLALLLLLFAGTLILPIWLESQTVEVLAEKVKDIEKDAKNIKALQSEVSAAADETQKLIDHKNALPPMVQMLNELSTLIKDDTWLAYAQYADGHLQIQGESPSASTLISILEASELFANARFVSPVTQDNISKLERFQITVDVTKPGNPDAKQ
ncbi:hypothetical protein JCM14076_12250 [Methylosoma difficile]